MISQATSGTIGALVRLGSEEKTVISFCLENMNLIVDRSKSSLAPWNEKTIQELIVPLSDNTLTLSIVVDHSIVEVIAQHSFAITR